MGSRWKTSGIIYTETSVNPRVSQLKIFWMGLFPEKSELKEPTLLLGWFKVEHFSAGMFPVSAKEQK